MKRFFLSFGSRCVAISVATVLCTFVAHAKDLKQSRTLEDFQKRAEKFDAVLQLPTFETTPAQLKQSVSNTIATANAALDRVGQLDTNKVTFENTVVALDNLGYDVALMANRIGLIKETSEDAAMRDAATAMSKVLDEWSVGVDYREDVYARVKAFDKKHKRLKGEDEKLLEETIRDYRRVGLELPKSERGEVEAMRKDLSKITTDFQTNVTEAKKAVHFTKADLEGVPEDFLTQKDIKTGDDDYTVMANVTWQYIMVMENAKKEATRKKLFLEREVLAKEKNLPLLQKIVELRDEIARKLGYATWADYKIEIKMAKTAGAARSFLEKLSTGLQPKFDAEVEEFRGMKAKDIGDKNAKINIWDWRYYANQMKKEKYTVDAEQLRVYFPFQQVMKGMFTTYETIFGLKIEKVEAPYKWTKDLPLYVISDAKKDEPLGMFYLDLWPREGKYSHFAEFGIVEGKLLANGKYRRPVVSLVCNFPPPGEGKPSLLSHSDVETLFHEFGHVLHATLTRAKYARFAGTSVPGDFVEAPSQMLENWVWDKSVLDSFAADYRDPTKKIPASILDKLKVAKLATQGCHYRRQISFGLLDLALHTEVNSANHVDVNELSNRILSGTFFPEPKETAFVAYFGHLMGYDGGYYGYAWADAIAADMATVFEKSKGGYLDKKTGMRLRKEVYEVGNSRDVNISIEEFLGRPRKLEPFLKEIGVETAPEKK
ncbi:MAG: hypothetical protein JWM68_5361 [Verrucomicrobiales bacterium]|nr:hypothetical protein [Verrucomicrobiales bacterium]